MRWTPARISTLMRMWDSGATSGEIGRELELTRSAVLGKVHRLGLSRHKGGRPFFDLPLKAFNCFLTENQLAWLRKTYGHKRMAAGIRAMVDEAMEFEVVKIEPKRVEKVARPAVDQPDSIIPWPSRAQLMGGR